LEQALNWLINGDKMTYIAGVNRDVDNGNSYFKDLGDSTGMNQLNQRNVLKRKEVSKLTLKARIEYSRWIVDCPNCHSAEFAFDDNLFWCSVCNNSNIQGNLYTVEMPEDRKELEVILGKRNIVNRHWNSNETLEKLEQENVSMGVI
jgi:hypothetical protein